MSIKTKFSIKDLENLSGVKAHTIRIWEKRYNLLTPERTDTNIREYDMLNLKKLFNVTHLYESGYKISKIAELDYKKIEALVEEHVSKNNDGYYLKAFKTAMFSFDNQLFSKTYKEALKNKTFRSFFFEVIIPLLNDIGMLWQTGTIDPSHERFISELIKQKLVLEIDAIQKKEQNGSKQTLVLFLPHNEIHEIGLLYTHYEVLLAGFKTIYLGSNIPLYSLLHLSKHHKNITFVTYLTVEPQNTSADEFIEEFKTKVFQKEPCSLWCLGSKSAEIDIKKLPPFAIVVGTIEKLQSQLEKLKNA